MDLRGKLKAIDAPEDLIDWARGDVGDGLATCRRGDWLIWVAGASGEPVVNLVDASTALLDDLVEDIPETCEGKDLLLDALDMMEDYLDGKGSPDECREIGEECERAANTPPVTYRSSAAAGFCELALAASWALKAVEGYVSARLQYETPRIDEAQNRAAMLGAGNILGSAVFLSADKPLVLDVTAPPEDGVQEMALYVVAALAESLAALQDARRARAEDESKHAADEAAGWAADRLRALLRGVE